MKIKSNIIKKFTQFTKLKLIKYTLVSQNGIYTHKNNKNNLITLGKYKRETEKNFRHC